MENGQNVTQYVEMSLKKTQNGIKETKKKWSQLMVLIISQKKVDFSLSVGNKLLH